ncbi:MAG: aspartate aminotransferase family protein, partial [Verrucomicrobiales bacterium]
IHCSNLYFNKPQADLAEFLVEKIAGRPGKVFFSNSGAEANDGLIKLARRYGTENPAEDGESRYELLTFRKSFHGRTLGSMSATGQEKIHAGFDPLLPGFRYLPLNDLDAVREAVGDRTVAILVEPVQGEGGVNAVSAEFLRGLRQLCDERDLLLMFDEIQCGMGRLGTLNGWEAIAPDIEPDALSWAKGMGGGVPIGSFWVSARMGLCDLLGPGSHGSTYGGNPLAAAASLAVVRTIVAEDLAENAARMGALIREEVSSWGLSAISEVRGAGLLLGLGLQAEGWDVPEGKTPALFLVSKLMEAGLLSVPAGPDTLRLLPPLNVTEDEVREALGILRQTLEELK